MSELHFIVNPVAGNGACLAKFQSIEAELKRRGVDYSAAYSNSTGHARELARRALAEGHRRIVATGGDGTVREVAEALIYSETPMGILPFGTGNDMARHLGLLGGGVNLTELLLHGEPRPMDAAMAGDQVYINAAGLGLDVDVLERTHKLKSRYRGGYSYLLGLFQALAHLRPYRVRITGGEYELNGDVFIVAVCNGTHFGGGMAITPKASVSDGLLDVCVIKSVRGLGIPALLISFLRGRHLDMKAVDYFKAETVTVECDRPAKVQFDGEVIGKAPITFKALPGAINMISVTD